MKIKYGELQKHGFVLLDSLDHKELIPFVRLYLNKKTPSSIMYTVCNLLIIAVLGFWFYNGYISGSFDLGNAFTYFAYGLPMAMFLIPIHEYIHVLAYKSQGAQNTSYDAVLRKFYFMALADKFVANKKEFRIIALAPFVVINSLLILSLLFVNSTWNFTILGILLMHTALSSGDFGLMSYFDFHWDKEIVTYDDVPNRMSYFYGKVK